MYDIINILTSIIIFLPEVDIVSQAILLLLLLLLGLEGQALSSVVRNVPLNATRLKHYTRYCYFFISSICNPPKVTRKCESEARIARNLVKMHLTLRILQIRSRS